jgi:hypothetical protein
MCSHLSITVMRRDEGLSHDIQVTCAVVVGLYKTLQCSVTAASLALHREPRLQDVSTSMLTQRVLTLRRALPSVDLTRMCVTQCPRLLASPEKETAFFVAQVAKLRQALPACEWIDLCVQEDPELCLCNFDAGLDGLRELWTQSELNTMDAEEAALALRAMSGLPRRGVVPGWTA